MLLCVNDVDKIEKICREIVMTMHSNISNAQRYIKSLFLTYLDFSRAATTL